MTTMSLALKSLRRVCQGGAGILDEMGAPQITPDEKFAKWWRELHPAIREFLIVSTKTVLARKKVEVETTKATNIEKLNTQLGEVDEMIADTAELEQDPFRILAQWEAEQMKTVADATGDTLANPEE